MNASCVLSLEHQERSGVMSVYCYRPTVTECRPLPALLALSVPHNLGTAYETAVLSWVNSLYRVELADVPRKAKRGLSNLATAHFSLLPTFRSTTPSLCLSSTTSPNHRGIIYSERWWICMSIYSTSSFKSKFIRFTDGTSQTLFVAEFFVFFFRSLKVLCYFPADAVRNLSNEICPFVSCSNPVVLGI